jgi:hypothetical protein
MQQVHETDHVFTVDWGGDPGNVAYEFIARQDFYFSHQSLALVASGVDGLIQRSLAYWRNDVFEDFVSTVSGWLVVVFIMECHYSTASLRLSDTHWTLPPRMK